MNRRTALMITPALAVMAAGAAVFPASAQTAVIQMQPATAPVQLAQTSTVILAPSAPPPPRVETVPPPPPSEAQTAYWRPGHWSWNGAGWQWTNGSYVMRPQPAAVWVPGQWMAQPSGGYAWVDGHWQG